MGSGSDLFTIPYQEIQPVQQRAHDKQALSAKEPVLCELHFRAGQSLRRRISEIDLR